MIDRRRFLALTGAGTVGLAGCLGDREYEIVDHTVPEQSGPLVLDLRVLDPGITVDSPARFGFELRNEGSEAVEIRNWGIWPLGVLEVEPGSALVSERYRDSEHVRRDGDDWAVEDVPLVESMAAGESVTERYTLGGERLFDAGTKPLRGYVLETGLLEYRRSGTDWTAFAPDITITFEVRSLLR